MEEDDEMAVFLTKGDHVKISNCFMLLEEEGTDDARLISFLKRDSPSRHAVVIVGHDSLSGGDLFFFSETDFPPDTKRYRLLQQLTKIDSSLKDKINHIFTISKDDVKRMSFELYHPLQTSLAMCNLHQCYEVNKVNTFIRLCNHNHFICKFHLQDENSPGWYKYLQQITEHDNQHFHAETENGKQAILGVCAVCDLDPKNKQHQILFRTMLMQQDVACPLFHTRRSLCSINLAHLQLEMEQIPGKESAHGEEMKVEEGCSQKSTNLTQRMPLKATTRVNIVNNNITGKSPARNSNDQQQGQNTYTPLSWAPVAAAPSSSSSAKNKALVVDLIDNDDQPQVEDALPKSTSRQRTQSNIAATTPPNKKAPSQTHANAHNGNDEKEHEWDEIVKNKKPPPKTNKRKTKADANTTTTAANTRKKPGPKPKKDKVEEIDDISSADEADQPNVDTKKIKSNQKGPMDSWVDSERHGPVEAHYRRSSGISQNYQYGTSIATRRKIGRVIEAVIKQHGKQLGYVELVMSEQDESSLQNMDVETLLSLVAIKEAEQPDITPLTPVIIDIDDFEFNEEDQPPSKKKFTGKPIILFVEQPEDITKGIIQVTVKTDMQYDDVLREVCKKLNFTCKRTQYMLVKVEKSGWNRKIEYERIKSSRKNMWGILDEGELVQVRQVQSAYLGGRYLLDFIGSFDSRNRSMKRKIDELGKDYEGYLEIRGDGNCYYRAVIYGVLEQAINEQAEDRKQRLRALHQTLSTVSFTAEEQEIEEHHQRLLDAILAAADSRSWKTLRELESDILMESTGFDQALIVVGKKLVVKYLDENQDTDLNGITPKIAVMAGGQYESFESYCEAEIMKMAECAEGLHVDIGVLPMLLNAYAEIVILDRNEEVGILKKGGQDLGNGDEDRAFSISLLFRPGHYDLLYKHGELPRYFMSSYVLPEFDRNVIEEEEMEVAEEQNAAKKSEISDPDLTDDEKAPAPSSTVSADQTQTPESVLPITGWKRKFSTSTAQTTSSSTDHHTCDSNENKPKSRKRSASNGTDTISGNENEETDTAPQTIMNSDDVYFRE